MQKTLFSGIFGAFAISCAAMVLLPQTQIGGLQPQVKWEEGQASAGEVYPPGVSQIGKQSFQSNGCYYCHSQQVRDPQYGPDVERGWGTRRTVARDYAQENIPLLGSNRMGPDFANYGSETWRNEPAGDPLKPVKRDLAWILQHMYEPRTIVRDSNCPPLPFLFEKRKVEGVGSANAIKAGDGFEVVPTDEAVEMARYILSQNRTHEVDEVKVAKTEEAKK